MFRPREADLRRLPPLTAIEAFVQVARLGSVKAAAEELALSSPALSRRIQALERFIGRRLFERRHQSMMLNRDGEQLLSRMGPALDALSEAVGTATGDTGLLRLRLGVTPLFASQRLMGRFPDLKRRNPDLHLDIDTASHALSRLGDTIDAAIVLARDIDPSLYSIRLSQNRVVPLGARTLQGSKTPMRRPEQLSGATVFIHRDMPETFTDWCEAIGMPDLEPKAIDHFDSGQLMLEAAAQGLGVAFMLDLHLEGANDPRLVSLFDYDVASPYAYWFACRRSALARQPVRIFHDWLLEDVRQPERVAA
jgi:LysR family glycine cleavage system transcriptional activator